MYAGIRQWQLQILTYNTTPARCRSVGIISAVGLVVHIVSDVERLWLWSQCYCGHGPLGADLCSTFGGRRMGPLAATRTAPCWGWVRTTILVRRITPRKILYTKPCILGNICAIIGQQNGSILLCWILMLRRFWINFLTSQLYNVSREIVA